MRIGVVGSRTLLVENLEKYLPEEVTELVSGGARGIDSCAKKWANEHNIPIIEFLPEYDKYGKSAPLIRNITIVKNSDLVIAFWDKKSRGTVFTLNKCSVLGVPFKIFVPDEENKNEYRRYYYDEF